MHITFIQTGGTIDKDYPRTEETHGYGFQIGSPAVEKIIRHCHGLFTHEIISACKKDSLDITDEDIARIMSAVQNSQSEKIIITHGTDTVLKTAEALALCALEKTIVFTGSMMPETFKKTEADFNGGMAVGAVQVLPPGIYIALYGRVVPWQEFKILSEEYEKKIKQ